MTLLQESVTLSGATMAWDADARIFEATYEASARPRPAQAREMQQWMDTRCGRELPFGMVVDLEHADNIGIAWRFRWMAWFYANRKRMRVAIHHARQFDAVARHFARATGTTIESYGTHAEARAAIEKWLAGQTI